MIQKSIKVICWLCASTLAIFLGSCGGTLEDEIIRESVHYEPEIHAQAYDIPAEPYIMPLESPAVITTDMPFLNDAWIAGDVPIPLAEPLYDDFYFYDLDVEDDLGIPAWQANIVTSHGLLPTRFQDKGPYLYSFDISCKAARNKDNHLGPLDFFDHTDDDDDDF